MKGIKSNHKNGKSIYSYHPQEGGGGRVLCQNALLVMQKHFLGSVIVFGSLHFIKSWFEVSRNRLISIGPGMVSYFFSHYRLQFTLVPTISIWNLFFVNFMVFIILNMPLL